MNLFPENKGQDGGRQSSGCGRNIAGAGLVTGFAICEALRLFPGGVPLLPSGDSTVFMNDARRLLEGQAIYRDFFQFTTPGAQVAYWLMFRALGVRAWVEDAVMLVLAIVLVGLTLEISTKILGEWKSLVAPLLIAGLTFRYYHDATHHWFSAVTAAAAICVLLPRRSTGRLIAAGILCGLTAGITQNKAAGLLLGLCVFVTWESWPGHREAIRKVAWLAGAAAVTFAVLIMPFLLQTGWRRLVELLVLFPAHHYSGVYANSSQAYMSDWPTGIGRRLSYVLMYGTAPLIFVVAALRARTIQTNEDLRHRVTLLACAGLGLFASALPAASGYRVASIAFVGFVLLAWLLVEAGRVGRVLAATLAVVGLCGMVMPLGARVVEMQLPVGKVAVPQATAKDLRWATAHTSSGEPFVGNPVLGFSMLYRMPPGLLYPSAGRYTSKEQYAQLIAWSEGHRPRFIVLHASALFPIYPTQGPDTAMEFRKYLESTYSSVGEIGDEEIFEIRKQTRARDTKTVTQSAEATFSH